MRQQLYDESVSQVEREMQGIPVSERANYLRQRLDTLIAPHDLLLADAIADMWVGTDCTDAEAMLKALRRTSASRLCAPSLADLLESDVILAVACLIGLALSVLCVGYILACHGRAIFLAGFALLGVFVTFQTLGALWLCFVRGCLECWAFLSCLRYRRQCAWWQALHRGVDGWVNSLDERHFCWHVGNIAWSLSRLVWLPCRALALFLVFIVRQVPWRVVGGWIAAFILTLAVCAIVAILAHLTAIVVALLFARPIFLVVGILALVTTAGVVFAPQIGRAVEVGLSYDPFPARPVSAPAKPAPVRPATPVRRPFVPSRTIVLRIPSLALRRYEVAI